VAQYWLAAGLARHKIRSICKGKAERLSATRWIDTMHAPDVCLCAGRTLTLFLLASGSMKPINGFRYAVTTIVKEWRRCPRTVRGTRAVESFCQPPTSTCSQLCPIISRGPSIATATMVTLVGTALSAACIQTSIFTRISWTGNREAGAGPHGNQRHVMNRPKTRACKGNRLGNRGKPRLLHILHTNVHPQERRVLLRHLNWGSRAWSNDAQLGFSPQLLANRRVGWEIPLSDPWMRE
jgi:hypothetical protein